MPVQPAHVMIEEHPKLKAEIERLENFINDMKRDIADLEEKNKTLHDQIYQWELRHAELKQTIRDILANDK